MKSLFTDIFYRAALAGAIGLLLAAPSSANAQTTPVQTPQAYCASLAPVSCEILNIDVGGMGGGAPTMAAVGVGIIKYCRNGKFTFVPMATLATNGNQASFTSSAGQVQSGGGVWNNTSLCAALP